jgi:hypothetical protein
MLLVSRNIFSDKNISVSVNAGERSVVIVNVDNTILPSPPPPEDNKDKKPFYKKRWYIILSEILTKFATLYPLATIFKDELPKWLVHLLHIH